MSVKKDFLLQWEHSKAVKERKCICVECIPLSEVQCEQPVSSYANVIRKEGH